MRNVKTLSDKITEDQLIDIVFTACRANEARKTTQVGDYRVEFKNRFTIGDEWVVVVINKQGIPLGGAVVDSMDC